MKRIPFHPLPAMLVCAVAFSLFLFRALASEPVYELARPVSISVSGQTVQLPAGQTVMVVGSITPDAGGNIMIRVTLPGGSLSMAQVPATSIRLKAAAPATPVPAAAATTPVPAVPAVLPPGSNSAPDFGPNVLVFDPSMSDIQSKIQPIANQQKDEIAGQFDNVRCALLFKPGTYKDVDIGVGFYMQVLGLGQTPDSVVFDGKGPHSSHWGNVTQTFWRAIENVSLTNKEMYWGVSQGTELRRVHAQGNLSLFAGGWASGGFFADCKINGNVISGSQQQWLSRNSEFGSWNGAVWNMVFVGVPNAPSKWPSNTAVDKTPVIAEKPYLFIDNSGNYNVMVPALKSDTQGETWAAGPTAGTAIPISQFYLAHEGKDTASSINAALAAGKNLILTPGIYHLETSILVTRPDTVVLGLGYPTLIPDKGTPAIKIADVNGVRLGGILLQASTVNSPTLLQVGDPGSTVSHAADPTIIYDIFARVGGAAPGSTDSMVTINSNNVIGDNAWLWRADHGNGVGWTINKNKNGLVVNGSNVTYYGLAVEHTQEYQTLWNGNGGRVYFYQSEIPYDVPNQQTWRHGSADGYASYKVADNVTTHQAWGLGVYSLFNAGACVLANAIETPSASGINMIHMVSIRLGGKPASGIAHVINGTGGNAVGTRFMQADVDKWP